MGIELIYESIYSGLGLSDSQLQIWTTFTFAILVAVHVGRDRIGRVMLRLAMALYGMYAGVLMLRSIAASFQVLHYQSLLVERNFEPWPVPGIMGGLIGTGTLVLLVGGTLATLWFVRATYRSAPEPLGQ